MTNLTYQRDAHRCVCMTWDRGTAWMAQPAMKRHHLGCRMGGLPFTLAHRLQGVTPDEAFQRYGTPQENPLCLPP